MRTTIHREAKDIPAHSCNDMNSMYPGYQNNPFQKKVINRYNAFFYELDVRRTRQIHMVYYDGRYKRVMKVSLVQETAYRAIEVFFKASGQTTVAKSILETLYRKATIDALVKKGLLFESNLGNIKLNRIS